MNIGWVAPCEAVYSKISAYFSDIEEINWKVHVFHSQPEGYMGKNVISYNMSALKTMEKLFPVMHYFADECAACKSCLDKRSKVYRQRVFLTKDLRCITFNELILLYLEKM